jgi:glycosyltransferase involved in cell wall biosynthesis
VALRRGLFSIVIPSLNEGTMLAMTTNSILTQTRYPHYEIIVVDDGSTDGSTAHYERYPNPYIRLVRTAGRGVARARNLGAKHARGEFLVFVDAHCRVSPNWLDGFTEVLSQPLVGVAGPSFTRLEEPAPRGCGMFWADHALDQHWYEPQDDQGPYVVPLTTGACQAFRHQNFLQIGRYQEGFTRWGFEDVEICLRAWLLGFCVAVNPAITIAHHFRESRGYEVDDVDVTENFLRMLHLHFSPARIQRVLAGVAGNPFLAQALERMQGGDVFDIRRELERKRLHDDEWFFAHIHPALKP